MWTQDGQSIEIPDIDEFFLVIAEVNATLPIKRAPLLKQLQKFEQFAHWYAGHTPTYTNFSLFIQGE